MNFNTNGARDLTEVAVAMRSVSVSLTPYRRHAVSAFLYPSYAIIIGPHAPYSWARVTRSAAKSLSFTKPPSSREARPTLKGASRTLAQLLGLWEAKSTPTLGP